MEFDDHPHIITIRNSGRVVFIIKPFGISSKVIMIAIVHVESIVNVNFPGGKPASDSETSRIRKSLRRNGTESRIQFNKYLFTNY